MLICHVCAHVCLCVFARARADRVTVTKTLYFSISIGHINELHGLKKYIVQISHIFLSLLNNL